MLTLAHTPYVDYLCTMEPVIIDSQKADRPLIRHFVEKFYTTVRQHDVIGPIFNDAIGNHWDEHFETLTDFWMTVLYGVHSYKGNPFLVHRQLPALEDGHFDIWLGIFETSAKTHLYEALADKAIDKAERIASSLRQGLFFKPNYTVP